MGVNVNGTVLPIEELHLSFLVNKLRTEYGFLKSSRGNIPCTEDGRVIPMYTYPCYEYLRSIDWSTATVFEFGAGFSTVWWNETAKSVVSGVEHNEEWFKSISSSLPNAKLTLETDKNKYINACSGMYDVIVVDGEHRADCASHAIEHLNEGGMIILDNTDIYDTAKNILDDADLIPMHFHGFKPIHVETETTSCYVKRDFNRKPSSILPMGGTKRELI